LNENSLVCVNKNSEVQNNELFVKGEFLNDPTFKLGSDEYFGSKPEYFEQTKVYHETDEEEEDVDIEADFKKDTLELLQASIENNVDPETVSMELNGLRLSYHATFSECIGNCMPVLLGEIKKKGVSLSNIQNILNHWSPLIKSITKSGSDELSLIGEIEKFCTEETEFRNSFHIFLQLLFKQEILKAESILDWAAEAEENDTEVNKKFLELTAKFIEFLKQTLEEDEDEEEEDEEEEDNDDDS